MTDLAALSADYFADLLAFDPFGATAFGAPGHDDAVPDPGRAADRAHLDRLAGFRTRLDALPAATAPQDLVTRDMLDRLLADQRAELASGLGVGAFEVGVTATIAGPQNAVFAIVPTVRPRGEEGFAAYLRRLAALGGYFDALGARYRQAAREGRHSTATGVRQAVRQLRSYLASPPAEDPFLRPAEGDPDRLDRVAAEVARTVRPALARLTDTLAGLSGRDDDRVGLCHVPGGEAAYAAATRSHTSTSWSPERLHRIGLDQLDRLREEFAALGERVFGTHDVPEVLRRLREDTSLRFATAEQIVDTATSALRRAEGALPGWFHPYAIAPCEVEPMHAVEAENSTLAYYGPPADDGSRPGTYVVNTHAPWSRPRYEYEALSFHESVPGHHLQIAVAQSLGDLPAFRRFTYVTAHAEGWGLYAERLADEMGLYSDDLSRMGMLSFDAWRACRLVVDTGMHHFGWSRDRAVAFLRDGSALSEVNVRNEIDRYIAWPGQATAYLVGRLRIEDLRTRAQRALGPRFDLRDFHHHVLANGAVPLDTLTTVIDRWTAA
ncbi:DUF885 domain-containing protein [Saccharothrix variisporea]|uniref:Uncharacterized protein (DUF885 family) n=1 Tax=Saccharothrix variisporea TaxID=543527 RepID=A0A495XQS2_9PSEU|nr:DUF885 domain-containing protein [Saccharothrix variisporea]RKT74008.1 uncharacterized protein (DUF885 family) [Saccharothrix variisporea]